MVQLLKQQLRQHSVIHPTGTTLPLNSDTGTSLPQPSGTTPSPSGGLSTSPESRTVESGFDQPAAENAEDPTAPARDRSAGSRPPLLHSASLPSSSGHEVSCLDQAVPSSSSSTLAAVLMDRMSSLEHRVSEQQRKSDADMARLLHQVRL